MISYISNNLHRFSETDSKSVSFFSEMCHNKKTKSVKTDFLCMNAYTIVEKEVLVCFISL